MRVSPKKKAILFQLFFVALILLLALGRITGFERIELETSTLRAVSGAQAAETIPSVIDPVRRDTASTPSALVIEPIQE